MIKKAIFLVMVLFIFAGCCGTSKSSRSGVHKFLEHAGIDWFNF